MSNVNANINVNVNTSAALAELKALQKQLALFHGSVSKGSAAAVSAQAGLQQNLLNAINATGQFSARMGVVRTSTESFTHALENNKMTMGQYFKYAGASTKTFGRLFKSEFDTIGKVAEERVRKMQTQYIKMGRDATGATRAMAITPNTLNMKDFGVQTAIAAQKQALFNQLIRQGSTNLLNFGKNTQWAGRQLMVGFTVPLLYFGGAASKVFMDLEKQTIKFKRVYGDMFTTPAQADKALEDIKRLANEYTKYGVQVSKTIEMAAKAAAMGKVGQELNAQVENATKLAVLGSVEQEQALETTISLTNAFGIAAEDLTKKIDFLNAVENQTALSIEDLTVAIPKAGPVVKQLGGDVEDLTFFMVAMKEGGINASEGANALKSGLASLINPTKKASDMLASMGINIKGIVEANKGNLKATVVEFARALDTLDPLNRSRAIEQLFGKFQFARLSTLFQNITKDGTQAAKTLQLAGASVEELAILSERELKTVEDAIGVNFKEAVEQLKVSIAPIGKEFLKAITPIVKFIGGLMDKFNGLSDGTKKFVVVATSLVGVIGPVLLMTFGLLANGAANIIKLFLAMRQGFLRLSGNSKVLAEQTTYLNTEQLEAATVAASLNQAHTKLTQQFQMEAGAVQALRKAYIEATVAAERFALTNPGMMVPGARGPRGPVPRRYATGVAVVPGTGSGDTVPAMLTPGEGVIPAPVMKDERAQALVSALISGKLFGYETGTDNAGGKTNFTHVGGAQKVLIEELLKDPNLSETDLRRLNVFKALLAAEGNASQADRYHGLGFTFDEKLNENMGKNGISIAQFEDEWDRQGYKKWQPSGILEMDAVAFDNELKAKVKDLAKNGTVTDKLVEKAFNELSPEMKKTPEYKTALKKYQALSQYQVKKGLPTTVSGLENSIKKAIKAGSLPDLDVVLLDGDALDADGVPKSKNAQKYLPKNSHVIVTRTNSKGKKVISSFWPTDEVGKPQLSMNRIGSGGKRFDIAQTKTRTPEEIAALEKVEKDFKSSQLKKEKVTDLGRQIGRNPGNSFSPDGQRIAGVGGFFEKPDGTRVFAKPMVSEAAALAEIRGTEIARDVHGLNAPVQRMIVMKDPITGMKMIGLESVLDEQFTAKNMTGKFTQEEFVKQLVASTLRGDKDLSRSNMSGGILTDVGPAGVFDKASGNTKFAKNMLSMEEQAMINLLGVKGSARKDFAEATAQIAKSMTADEYHNAIIKEIDTVLPKLKSKVDSFGLSGEEKVVYEAMIKRLEDGRKVDWRQFHKIHSSVLVAKDESLQDKKTGKITKVKKEPKPKNVKPSTGKIKDDILTTVPPTKRVVKTPKPRVAGKVIVPGFADAPYANPYDGMSDKDKAIAKSIRRQAEKLQREKLASLKLEQKQLKVQEDLKKKIAKSRGEANYNRFTNSGMTKDQIAIAKSIQRNLGTQGQISPYINSGMTKDEIANAKSQRRNADKLAKEKAYSMRQEQKVIASRIANEKAAQKAKEERQAYKRSPEYKQQRMAKVQGAGMALGMASTAAYMSGNTGLGNAMMGLSVLSMIGPMLANPAGLVAVGLVAAAGMLYKFNKDMDAARKRGVEYGNALSMGKSKLVSLSKITGTVSAQEAADRRRKDMLAGGSAVQRKTGQTILESDFGKTLLSDIEKQATNKVSNSDIAKNIGKNLSVAVMQGVITTDQAKSISMALGEKLGNYAIPASITGNLVALLGPNGENLIADPLKVAVEIQKQSMDNLEGTFKTAIENSVTTSSTLNWAQLIGGVSTALIGTAGLVASVPAIAAGGAGIATGAGSAAVTAAGVAIAADAWQEQKKLEMSTELKSAAVQLGIQELAQNQGLVDSLNKQYDIKVKSAKTTEEINKLEAERKAAIDKIAENNKKALDYLVSQQDLLGSGAFMSGIEAEVTNRYKDSGAMKAFADQAMTDLKALEDSKFKTQIGLEFASDNLDPMTVSRLVKLATSGADIDTKFNTLVSVTGSTAEAGTIIALLTKANASDTTIPVIVEFLNKDGKNIEGNTKALSWLSDMQTKYGITIDINKDGVNKIKNVRSLMNKLAGENTKPITKDIIVQELKDHPNDPGLSSILQYWDAITNGKQSVTKQVLIDFVAAGDMNVVDAYLAATGQQNKIPSFLSPQAQAAAKTALMPEAQAWLVGGQGKNFDPYKKVPGAADQQKAGSRDTTLDDLLTRLKRTRDMTIDAQGGVNELMRILGKKKDIKIFNGLDEQLARIKNSPAEFIDFIGGMEKGIQKGYIKVNKKNKPILDKKGNLQLTDAGIAAQKGYQEAAMGDYVANAAKEIVASQNQRTAMLKLTAAGMDSKEALDALSDANFANAVAAATDKNEIKELAKAQKEQAAEADRTLKANDPVGYFQKYKDLATERLNAEADFIRLSYEPRIKQLQDLIDGEGGLNEQIKDRQRLLEVDGVLGQRRIDSINKEIDVMQHAMQVGVEKQLTAISNQSSAYSEDLAIINHTVDGINEKYDKQEEALSKINDLNKQIAQEQRQQLDLADALSQGDIAAAAKAAQAMRQSAADAAAQSAQDMLKTAREAEIASVKSAGGLTADQIAEKQYQLDRQSYQLNLQKQKTEESIAALQEQIYQINLQRETTLKSIQDLEDKIYDITYTQKDSIDALQKKMTALLKPIEDQKLGWEKAQNAIDLAQTSTDKFKSDIMIANGLLSTLAGLWQSIDKKTLAINLKMITDAIQGSEPMTTPTLPSETNDVAIKAAEEKAAASKKALDEANAALKAATERMDYLNAHIVLKDSWHDDIYQPAKDALAAAAKMVESAKASYEAAAKDLEALKAKAGGSTTPSTGTGGTGTGGTTNPPAASTPTYGVWDPVIGGVLGDPSKDHGSLIGVTTGKDGKKYNSWSDGTWTPYVATTTSSSSVPASTTTSATSSTTTSSAAVGAIDVNSNGFFDSLNSAADTGAGLNLNINYDMLSNIDWSAFAKEMEAFAMLSTGGLVPKYFAAGGYSRGTDTIPAMLTPGEFVIRRKAVDKFGINNLNRINSGDMSGTPVYNYKVDVTLNGSNMDPNDVANAVMTKIKQVESKNIRRNTI